jgi:hypothetical protein
MQFCGKISFWRAYQKFEVPTSSGIKRQEGQISQIEMEQIECDKDF